MGSPKKAEQLEQIKNLLKEKKNFVVSTYSGLTVEKMTDLRRRVRAKNGRLRVLKNNLVRKALAESDGHKDVLSQMDPDLFGPIAYTFVEDRDFPAVTKALLDYSKEADMVKVRSGSLEGRYLPTAEVKQIANLPSREEMLAIIGRGLNTPAQKIAVGMKEVITSIARAVKAVGEKNGG
ncbi:MAG: 50S ribosomal protein L10 [Spirochaetia bacterium]|nr:50S ribosomal protein L10 [Spirochaetia bacterium]